MKGSAFLFTLFLCQPPTLTSQSLSLPTHFHPQCVFLFFPKPFPSSFSPIFVLISITAGFNPFILNDLALNSIPLLLLNNTTKIYREGIIGNNRDNVEKAKSKD